MERSGSKLEIADNPPASVNPASGIQIWRGPSVSLRCQMEMVSVHNIKVVIMATSTANNKKLV